jgi:hypothetical protein
MKITGTVTPPTISNVVDQTINEDDSLAALGFTIGDTQSPANLLQVSVSSSNTALVPNANLSLGGSGANRTVTATPVGNQSGSTTITLTVNDGNGGVASDTFVLNVNPVNDRPTFTGGANQSVFLSTSSEQIVSNWATGISRGPANESSQTLQFVVTSNSLPGNFTAAPTINPTTGALRYTLAQNATGIANITIALLDDGGTANGGQNTSLPYTFSIEARTPYHNVDETTDVDDDGQTSAIDLIYVVEALNSGAAGPLTTLPTPPVRYLDANHDNNLSAIDLLLVVEMLNRQSFFTSLSKDEHAAPVATSTVEPLDEIAFSLSLKPEASLSSTPIAMIDERRSVLAATPSSSPNSARNSTVSDAELHDLAVESISENPDDDAVILPELDQLLETTTLSGNF